MSDAPHDELDEEDDELSLSLGRLEREAALVEPRPQEWGALARGELSLQDALASRASDPDAERAAAYFRPFDEAEQGDLVDGLLASLAAPAPAPAQPSEAPTNVVPLAPAKPKPHDPATSSFWWIPGGMLAAAAAAILAWWVWPPSLDVQRIDELELAVRDPLPNYVLETDGGLKQLRGETGSEEFGHRHRYRRETAFEWVLRPKLDFAEAVGVRGFAFVDGGRAGLPINLEPLATVAKSGAIRIVGNIGELNLEPGRYTIVLAVGRPEQLPSGASEVLERGEQASDADATWLTRRIEIVIED